MQEYVCGFMFSEDRTRVLLIQKTRPAWQEGRLNGVGGKIEPGETPVQAMLREFREEAGLHTSEDQWLEFVRITGEAYRVYFFRTFGEPEKAQTMTDESVQVCFVSELPKHVLPNIPWLIPLALCDEAMSGEYQIDNTACIWRDFGKNRSDDHEEADRGDLGQEAVGEEHPGKRGDGPRVEHASA